MKTKPCIALTMGDPAGVGPEITLKSFLLDDFHQYGVPIVCGDFAVLNAVRERLAIPVDLVRLSDPAEAAEIAAGPIVPILDQGVVQDPHELEVGRVSALAGRAGVAYIQAAVDLCRKGVARGIATAPINKESLRAGNLSYIGHTEMIAEMSTGRKGITMFQVDKMKIFFHSRHVSLRRAIDLVTTASLLESLAIAERCLESVGITKPTIAVAGLNPHSSDGGLFGDEEAREVRPAVEQAQQRGQAVVGPVSADSVFHLAAEGRYDAVLSLYHDQGHIASKCYDFHRVVAVTFGYPFIRTSVDHGTALDIAWQGVANPVSMKEAVRTCFALAESYTPIYPEAPWIH